MFCSLCGAQLNILSQRKIADGAVCKGCFSVSTPLSATKFSAKAATVVSLQSYHSYCMRYAQYSSIYKHTSIVKKYISADTNNRLWRLETIKGADPFQFSELLSYDLVEDGVSTNRINLGGAIAGGFLFGGVGAVIGGLGKQKKVVESMSIRITVANSFVSGLEIKLFENMSLKTTSALYKDYAKKARDIMAILENIYATGQAAQNYAPVQQNTVQVASQSPMPATNNYPVQATQPQTTSIADDIQKLKTLLDDGAITSYEYELLKKDLLQKQHG